MTKGGSKGRSRCEKGGPPPERSDMASEEKGRIFRGDWERGGSIAKESGGGGGEMEGTSAGGGKRWKMTWKR